MALPNEEKWIVEKIDSGMDRHDILCTTYQMRNPFGQFHDGVATELDAHCYFQHVKAASLCTPGGRVLDVCCGRGLLIPFLRYSGIPVSLYVGVDIEPKNARWIKGADPRNERRQKVDWGFRRMFVHSNVAEMAELVQAGESRPFNLIVYTSSIEHMQPEAQQQSLHQCAILADDSTILYLSCPVSEEGRGGYDAQYRAHVYEPSRTELKQWLEDTGWQIVQIIGLSTKRSVYEACLKDKDLEMANHLYNIMPRIQALPTIAALFPQAATELSYICKR